MRFAKSGAYILSDSKNGVKITSCGGRISTMPGSALELYNKAIDNEKNLNLVSKVVASGHRTILEHHYFNIAFNNVSIFVEQYLIEFRLTAFTIKSGRYVNFSSAGFNLPDEFTSKQSNYIKKHYTRAFKLYDKFVEGGIPVEDARFVLPYGLKTNIYMSCNARELIHIISTMIYGPGKYYTEIYNLGCQLKKQFDKIYPGIIEKSAKDYTDDVSEILNITPPPCENIEYVSQDIKLLNHQFNIMSRINDFAKFTGFKKFDFDEALKYNKQAKLLEHFNFSFKVKNFSLIILKHYCRHRMQSLSTEPIVKISFNNKFVIPESIAKNPEFKSDFEKCIENNRHIYNVLLEDNINPYLLIYMTPHATATNFLTTLNGRELLHIMNLRTCERAQWEIRNMATEMLRQLKEVDSDAFKNYGPSCYTFGSCPEGRLCCGKQSDMKNKFDNLR